eukprot:CAMPEP_0204570604 /NCGR_PEP_ID=MMETSP0661-20131031/38417_1 /ASSEMBLY_ACC=CAM_ASM_000606 /TAXON_ID=109239 /ORGANISM="Alexandrium margalefi, Strain AMGDE01CS-322" /LENGTH=50 /DNA_ID=CAMNT_0051578797 /DNA_START=58 /DNA_END=207 /DNA_ORIENTATION=-
MQRTERRPRCRHRMLAALPLACTGSARLKVPPSRAYVKGASKRASKQSGN